MGNRTAKKGEPLYSNPANHKYNKSFKQMFFDNLCIAFSFSM